MKLTSGTPATNTAAVPINGKPVSNSFSVAETPWKSLPIKSGAPEITPVS